MTKHTSSTKSGFTIVEVALFLALSGFLMVGVIIGANASISRQRYNDSVNSFAEFIRGTYSDVLNVSNNKNPDDPDAEAGRSTTAIYGKLISIGEDDSDTVYTYDLVGNAVSSSSVNASRVIDMIQSSSIGASIFTDSGCDRNPVGCTNAFYNINSYEIPWGGNLSRGNDAGDSNNGARFHGAILIIRSPVTGSIRTYNFNYDEPSIRNKISEKSIGVNFHSQTSNSQARNNFKSFLQEFSKANLNNGGENEMTICIDSDDNTGSNRRGVKIAARATNSSGVMLTEMDGENALCKGRKTF